MKFKARHKLIPAIAMLLVSAVVLSSASFAWFTMSRTVTATGMELTAIAPTNLLIASGNTAWNSDTPGAFGETTSIQGLAALTSKLIPASSVQGTSFFAADEVKSGSAGAPTAATTFTDVSAAATYGLTDAQDGYFVDIPLWLKTTGEDSVDVTVSSVLTAFATLTGEGTPASEAIKDAVRFAVLDDEKAVMAANTGSIYNPSQVASPYFATVTGPIAAATGEDAWKGVAAKNIDTSAKIFTVAGGEAGDNNVATKIYIRIWIEGQDKACINTNAAKSFNLTIGFRDVDYTVGLA